MTYILQAGDNGSIGHQDVSQGQYRDQINAINDAVRQLGGKPLIEPGDTAVNDPLNRSYVLHVNPDIGSDKIVFGDYASSGGSDSEGELDTNSIMRRIRQQQLECGYTEARPFRSLNRAVIECGILTSRDYHTDCSYMRTKVTIVISGQNKVYNGLGAATDDAFFDKPYTDGQEIPEEDLELFNPTSGGLILPRGCSLVSLDLRKTILTPDVVPCPKDKTGSSDVRMPILLTTGEGYYYGVTFMDCPTYPHSHHLLTCFEGASKAELDQFYLKIEKKFGDDIDFSAFVETDLREYQIVGPQPATPSEDVDTTASASPYIYNCSIRSEFGLCGIDYDGAKVGGFRSLVTAQFTGVSLQTDVNAYEIYVESSDGWRDPKNYQEVIDTDPNNVRIRPKWGHFHIRAINNAVIQEVSVFAIGQAVHHWTRSGGEITITNSNSNFGQVAALSEGFHEKAQPQDEKWQPVGLWRSRDPFDKTDAVEWIYVGSLQGGQNQLNDSEELNIKGELVESSTKPQQPDIVASRGYTLKENDYIWVRNNRGDDYRARLAKNPWDRQHPDRIRLKEPMETQNGDKPGDGDGDRFPDLARLDVFIRRFVDLRTEEERTSCLVLKDDDTKRFPVRDYVLQDVAGVWTKQRISAVAKATQDKRERGFIRVELRNCNATGADLVHEEAAYYHKGDTINRDGKHFNATVDHMGKWDPDKWQDSYVHMPADYKAPGTVLNSHPVIIFDGDTDDREKSKNCGFNLDTPIVKGQWKSATDWKGLAYYCGNAGIAVQNLLRPQPQPERFLEIDVDKINLHRPSQIRLFGHAYEWSGYGPYSKALPRYQQTLTPANKWTYYQTAVDGGKNYISGFNEEGFLVTNNGLQDLETGESVNFANLGSPDRDLDLTGLEVVDAQIRTKGVVELADGEETYLSKNDRSIEERDALNADINTSKAAVTPPFLKSYLDQRGYVRAKDNVAAVVIHVVPDGVTPLQEQDSVPYGYPDNKSDYTWYREQDYINGIPPKTVTEALKLAARVYVPPGAYIIISVHGDIPTVEEGPLQLVNSWAPIVVAGAQGVASQRGPKIRLDATETARATDQFPQFTAIRGMSAGVLFADCHIMLNSKGLVCSLTFNGGLAIGAKDTTIEVEELSNLALMDASFGEKVTWAVYSDVNGDARKIETIVQSVSADYEDHCVQFMGVLSHPRAGTGTGISGHGVDIVIDFRNANYGNPGYARVNMKFANNTNTRVGLSWVNLGGRGGCRAGGRVGPRVGLNLSGNEWDLEWWIGRAWRTEQNHFGRHFRMEDAFATSPNEFKSLFNMTDGTYNTLKPCILEDGCVCEIKNEDNFQCGPFNLYKNWETAAGSEGEYLWARNNRGAYVFGSTANRNKDGDKPWL